MTDKLKEAIEVLKEIQGNDNRKILEVDRVVIDTVVAELDYLSKYSDELKKTAIPHINKIEVLIRKQHRSPQEITWHIAEASSIVGKAYYRGFGNGFDECIKFAKKRKDANKDRKQG
jgi:hypothetical protein